MNLFSTIQFKIFAVLLALTMLVLNVSADTKIKCGVNNFNNDRSHYLNINHSGINIKSSAEYYKSNNSESYEFGMHYSKNIGNDKDIFVYTDYQKDLSLNLDHLDFGLGGGITFYVLPGVKFKPSFAYVLRGDEFLPSTRLKLNVKLLRGFDFNASGDFIGSQSKIIVDSKYKVSHRTNIGASFKGNRVGDLVNETFQSYLEVDL